MFKQHCMICAWRETCAKRFSVSDSGSRCPDFCRDISIKNLDDEQPAKEAPKETTRT